MNGDLNKKDYKKCAAAISYGIVKQAGYRIGKIENIARNEMLSAKEIFHTVTITVEKNKKEEDIHHLNIEKSTYKDLKMITFKQ